MGRFAYPIFAHVGGSPAEVAGPFVVAIAFSAPVGWLYLRGLARMPGVVRPRARFVSFAASIVTLAVVLSPPVDSIADAAFSAHMAQHVVLLMVVPVLLTYSRALRYVMMGLPAGLRRSFHATRRTARRWLRRTSLPVVGVTFALTLWVWHLPILYDTALSSDPVHVLEHACYLLAGILFWSTVTEVRRGFIRRGMLVFGTAFHSGLLGALLSLAPTVLYRSHLEQTLLPISPLQDQQLAGLIMWIPMGAMFLVTLAVIVFHVLERPGADLVSDA